MVFGLAVRKVDPRHVEPFRNEHTELVGRRGRRADGGDDLGAPEKKVFVVKVKVKKIRRTRL
jgi:hypothetical protein